MRKAVTFCFAAIEVIIIIFAWFLCVNVTLCDVRVTLSKKTFHVHPRSDSMELAKSESESDQEIQQSNTAYQPKAT